MSRNLSIEANFFESIKQSCAIIATAKNVMKNLLTRLQKITVNKIAWIVAGLEKPVEIFGQQNFILAFILLKIRLKCFIYEWIAFVVVNVNYVTFALSLTQSMWMLVKNDCSISNINDGVGFFTSARLIWNSQTLFQLLTNWLSVIFVVNISLLK